MPNLPDYEYHSGTTPLLIDAHCSTVQHKGVHIDSHELSSILDDFVRELNATAFHSAVYFSSINEIVLALNAASPPALLSLTSHYFFVLVRNTIQVTLQGLHVNYQLSQLATYVLRNCILLLEYMVEEVNDVSKLLHWITDLTLLDALGNCLHTIERIAESNESRLYIKQITRLLDIFIYIQEHLPEDEHNSLFSRLLNPVIKCLTSANYVHAFKDLKPNTSTLNPYQKLLLVGCPHFLASYHGPRIEQKIEQVLEVMLPRYVSIIDTHIKTIKKWRRPIKLAVYHLLTILVFAEGYFITFLSNHLLQTLINHLLRLVNESTLIEEIHEIPDNSESLLIDAALQVINVLVREPDALDYLKQCQPTMTFRRLLSTPCEAIITNTYAILAYSINENDIQYLDSYLTRLLYAILSALQKAVDYNDETNDDSGYNPEYIKKNSMQLAETLTGLVRHEEIKREIVKQNALPLLVKFSHNLTGLAKQFILETLWTLSFDKQVAQQLRDDLQFMHLIQNVRKPISNKNTSSNNNNNNNHQSYQSSNLSKDDLISWNEAAEGAIYKIATGLLWTLHKESQIRQKTSKTASQSNKFDVAISYSIKDKDVVTRLEETLINEGYAVWIDRDILHRQSMESVSEAMNKSTVVIVCLSEWYVRDNQCVCESVYAMNSKRVVVPLIVEKGYVVNSWLLSMLNKSGIIEYDVNDSNQSNELVKKEISQYCRKKVVSKKVTLAKPKIYESNSVRFAANSIDKPKQQKVDRPRSRTVAPTRATAPVDQEQQSLHRSNSRNTPSSITPIPQTPMLINTNYHKYLPQDYTKRDTSTATYRTTLINAWKKKDILDFLYDFNLHLMMPLCDSMSGRGLLKFYRMCQRKPSRVHAQLNSELRNRFRGLTLPMGMYTQFLIELDNILEGTTDPVQIVTPTPAKNIPQVIFMPIAAPISTGAKRSSRATEANITSSKSLNDQLIEVKSDGNTIRNTRIIERTIFRPASTADRPYDFIVETGEESRILLEQVGRYAPQLYFLQQKAQEQYSKQSSRSE
ncbi:unnamed protein product [Adineta ricciae]|uniref:TIR domain-containing protein n=1 Tax=Adineta ricciae TaxID=249248 RepID=A0A814IIQ9_ADIRI|nr:unnamed protein product [Adineta ricciae]CAF1024672.1 unnamed protein product [Adineta ricciae]